MKKTTIYILSVIAVLLLSACTRNHGDIGIWFGTWHIEQITAGGTPVNVEGDYFFQFQNKVFRVSQVYGHENLVESFGTWQESEDGSKMTVSFPDESAFYFTGEPSPLGFGGAEVNAVMEVSGYVTVSHVEGFTTKPASLTSTPNVVAAVVGTNQTTTLSNRVGTCTAVSSNAGVATASVSTNTVTITPVAAGTCVITITDGTSGESIPISVTVTAS